MSSPESTPRHILADILPEWSITVMVPPAWVPAGEPLSPRQRQMEALLNNVALTGVFLDSAFRRINPTVIPFDQGELVVVTFATRHSTIGSSSVHRNSANKEASQQ